MTREERNARQREFYAANRASEQKKARERRAASPDLYRKQQRSRYWINPERARSENRRRYAEKREYHAQKAREYRKLHPEKIRAKKRLETYGISLLAFQELWNAQNGRCAICLDILTEERRRTHVDHCHASGAVRGLLCVDCNVGLGRFRDSVEALRRAADYLGLYALGRLEARRLFPGAV